ncbi:hypothetical protein HDU86_004945 [Geranomyces michiganensis]|nr:hypothetical protein HDU86_004945 [Geranomyces michiganensis]
MTYLTTQVTNLVEPCGLGEVVNAVLTNQAALATANGSIALIDSLVHSQTFLPKMCSDKCNSALGTTTSSLTTTCGTTPLLAKPTTTAGAASQQLPVDLSNMNAADVASLITYGRNVICTKDGNNFCAATLFDSYKAAGMPAQIAPAQYCNPCGANIIKAANQTSGLTPAVSALITPALNSGGNPLDKCTADQLKGASAGAAGATTPSSAAKQTVGLVSGALAFAASLIFA